MTITINNIAIIGTSCILHFNKHNDYIYVVIQCSEENNQLLEFLQLQEDIIIQKFQINNNDLTILKNAKIQNYYYNKLNQIILILNQEEINND